MSCIDVFQPCVPCCRCTSLRLLQYIDGKESFAVFLLQPMAYVETIIGGVIIDQYKVNRSVMLCENRCYGTGQLFCPVIDRYDNAHGFAHVAKVQIN